MIGQSDISYKEIRNVLNAHGGNVGSRHSDFFSEKAKINKWSKRKPVEHQKMFKLTDEDFASVNWGWKAESYANPFRMIDAWCGDFWSYTLPSGNLRISDFIGYDPNAVNPFLIELLGSERVKAGDTVRIATTQEDIQSIVGTYKVFDGIAYDLWYVGVMFCPIFKVGMNKVYYCSVSSIIDYDNDKISFTVPNEIADGSYSAIVVFTSYAGAKFEELSDKQDYHSEWVGIPCNAVTFEKVQYITPDVWKQYGIAFNNVTISTTTDPRGYLLNSLNMDIEQTLGDYPYGVHTKVEMTVQTENGDVSLGSVENDINPNGIVTDSFAYTDSDDKHVVMVEMPEKIGVMVTVTTEGEQRVWQTSASIEIYE